MKMNFKRFLSLLLAMIMVVGMMPMGHVHAEEETVMVLGEKVTEVAVGTTYVITLAGSKNALSNQKGSTGWGTDTLATVNVGGALGANILWTLESAEDGYKVKNESGYVYVERNTAALNETGHIFELGYTDAGWTFKSLETNEYFNNLGDSGSIGGWSGDGTKFDIYSIVESSADEVDPWGKRNWVEVSVDTETVYDANEGQFEYAWDNNPRSIWHSNWQGASDKLTGENSFSGVINFGKAYSINQFSFTPRTDKNSGIITQASLYVKENEGDEWKAVAEHATFATNNSKKTFCFEAQNVQYVKFVAEQSNDGWVTVSEFDINYDETHTVTKDVTAPTCGAAGYTTYTCYCGGIFTVAGDPATGIHTAAEDDGDCTTAISCSVCGQEAVAAKEHAWSEEGVYTEPTDDAVGYTTYSCTNEGCNKTKVVNDENTEEPAFTSEKLTGLTGTASSNDSGDGSNIEEAFDGITNDANNYWASVQNDNGIANNEYLIANLNGKYLVNQVAYTSRTTAGATGNLNDYVIWVSTDGETWEKVAEGTIETLPGTTTIKFAPVEATHVKLTATQSVHWKPELVNKVMAVAEFEIFKAVCEEHEWVDATCTAPKTCSVCGATEGEALGHSYTNAYDPDCNVCDEAREVKTFTSEQLTGLTGTASSNDSGDGSNIEEAFDGIKDQASNYWASVQNNNGIENNEYLIANLNGKYLVNQVAYTSRTTATATGNLNDYVIWVSTDGENYEKVAEGTIETLPGTTVITFDAPVEATHVKLTATQSVHWKPVDVNKVMAAAEFEVFKAVCEEHEYDDQYDADCNVCGAEREVPTKPFDIDLSSITMGNYLEMNFAFAKSGAEFGDGYYAKVVKEYADGTTKELEIPYAEWKSTTIDGVAHYYVIFKGIAAKEMTDDIHVTIYNAKGVAVSNTKTDSIQKQAMRNLEKNYSDPNNTMVVDMLNYGAEAQKNAGYNLDNLANSLLSEEQKAFATETVAFKNEMSFIGAGKYMANVKMLSNIQFMMAFSGVDQTMKAVVTFTNWEGKEITKEIPGTEFVKNGGYYVIIIEETVIADARQEINCKIVDTDGNTVAEVTDSIASYADRTTKTPALYEAIMKFSDSALAYLKTK